MAEALLKGMLRHTHNIIMSDPRKDRLEELNKKYGVSVTDNNDEVAASSEVVIFAVKPQAAQLLGALNPGTAEPLYISILAGVATVTLEKIFGEKKIRLVRAMPNTPAFVMKGITLLCRGSYASGDDIRLAGEIFGYAGSVITINEGLIDAATGVSGCGPAYFYIIMEALADAGVRAGLKREDALLLAAHTASGAAQMVLETGLHPAALKDMVTSPGGATIEAVKTLEDKGIRGIMMDAVDAAVKRTQKLQG